MKSRSLLCYFLFFTSALSLKAQTFSGTGGAISNTGTFNYFNLSVSGLSSSTLNSSFGLEEACLDISHTNDNDIIVYLESPNGTQVELTSTNGGAGFNYTGTCFNSSASTNISNGTAPFTGSYKPEGFLGAFNDGQNGNGTWKLLVKDWNAGNANSGTLNSFSIKFSNTPAQPLSFTSSNLPIVVINTNGQTILDEPKITVDMGVIYNGQGVRNNLSDPYNNYNGKAAIEMRGSSSQNFAKKPYGFETISSLGTKQNVPLLGMPAEHDWILFPSYIDKSLLRNWLTYSLSNQMGDYASRGQYVEVVLNGRYQGVYILMEKIKRDKNRVDISKLDMDDNAGDSLTGGYIIKIDKLTGTGGSGFSSKINSLGTTKKVFFQYDYPNEDSITSAQKAYIEGYMDTFESVLMSSNFADPVNGYRKYIDVNTFIDFFILNEYAKNVDGYKVSTFMYKDKDSKDGRLKIGPVWDFDIAWGNCNYGNGNLTNDWEYNLADTAFPRPIWWTRFMQDPQFVNDLKCRWETLRQSDLSTASINGQIDAQANYLNEAQARNFTWWPIIGTDVFASPSPYPTTWQGEVDYLKTWVNDRGAWLDANMQGTCILTVADVSARPQISVFPNPFQKSAHINFTITQKSNISLKVFDALGKEISSLVNEEKNEGNYDVIFDGTAFSAGLYYYQLRTDNSVISGKMILNN